VPVFWNKEVCKDSISTARKVILQIYSKNKGKRWAAP
jgi:hypothetical protein